MTEIDALAAAHLPNLPEPAQIRPWLRQRLDAEVARIRTARGEVHGEEDVYPLVRAAQSYRELLDGYGRAFKAAADDAKAVLAEEMEEVVPESDGIPQGRLAVPHDGTLITIAPKTENRHDVDRDQVLGALAALVADEWTTAEESAAGVGSALPSAEPEQFAIEVAGRALDMVGAAQLKVTHVRALAARLGHLGADGLAAVVRSAIRTTRIYKGVTVDRVDDPRAKAS